MYDDETRGRELPARRAGSTDEDGWVEFTSIFPACYSGRWPHVHFEVYESLSAATSGGSKLRTSQLRAAGGRLLEGLRDRRLRAERQQPVPGLPRQRQRLRRRVLAAAGQGDRQRRRRVRRGAQRAGLTEVSDGRLRNAGQPGVLGLLSVSRPGEKRFSLRGEHDMADLTDRAEAGEEPAGAGMLRETVDSLAVVFATLGSAASTSPSLGRPSVTGPTRRRSSSGRTASVASPQSGSGTAVRLTLMVVTHPSPPPSPTGCPASRDHRLHGPDPGRPGAVGRVLICAPPALVFVVATLASLVATPFRPVGAACPSWSTGQKS